MLIHVNRNVSSFAMTAVNLAAVNLAAMCVGVFCMASPALATMVTQSLDELTVNSSHVVRGQVLAVESKWNENQTSIFTEVTIDVSEVIKASGSAPTIATVIIPGGTVGDTRLWVEHTPVFAVGQDVVTFLIDHGAFFEVTSWVQGKFTVEDEKINELGSTATQFIGQINEVVAAERKRNGEK